MQSAIGTAETAHELTMVSPARRWTSWIITGLIVAFLLFDIVGKLMKPAAVVEGFARSGWPIALSVPIGIILLACTILYVIPQTTILGAILLTGYLGGAVATNFRLQSPIFSYTLVPVYFGVLVWLALWLRDRRLQALVPLRSR
jgi:hypothetical protein